jgi:hypothetical protein
MKAPKGVLSWTDEELAEYGRTKRWPECEVPNPSEPSPLPPHLEQKAAELGAAIRGYWRADGNLEGFRKGRKQGRRKGLSEARSVSAKNAGKALGKKRRAKAEVWKEVGSRQGPIGARRASGLYAGRPRGPAD